MEKLVVQKEQELEAVAQKVLDLLLLKKSDTHASVLALHGDLGSGKTAFVKALAKVLKVEEVVTSPTFVILKIYPLSENLPFSTFAHIDAYKIEDLDEMRVIHFSDLLQEERTLVCIEWAEKIEKLLPHNALHLSLKIVDEKREITIA